LFATAAVLAAALLAGAGYLWWTSRGTDPAAASCTERPTVTVAVTPALAEVVRAAADRAREAGSCAAVEVQAVSPVAVVGQITSGQAPDAWVADSSLWIAEVSTAQTVPTVSETAPREWTRSTSIATSPVVIAIPPARADQKAVASSWRTLLAGSVPLRMPDPNQDAVGRVALFAARAGLGDAETARKVAGPALISLSRTTTANADQLLQAYLDDPTSAPMFPVTEQTLTTFNRMHGDARLAATIPAEGTVLLDYPWVDSPSGSGTVTAALTAVRQQLTSVAGVQDIAAAGFRSADGEGDTQVEGLDRGRPKLLPELSAADRQSAVSLWNAIRANIRMLAVIDVSGSMKQEAGSRTRIELALGAARTALGAFPAGTQVGLWEFSIDRGRPGQDWKSLVPIRDTASAVNDRTQNQLLLEAFEDMVPRVGGDTGLYDTVLAAFREVKRTYESGAVNSVVLLTDGVNEDPRGIGLEELLTTLEQERDAQRPVRVILVGMGPDTDAKTLSRIAGATGGRSYVATNPQDITTVFVQAILSRS
jgi:Mg-chelatase subunit ChlD